MYQDQTIAAVIPAYNEEGFIGSVIETLPPYIDRAYVIDDGSSDDTWAEICAHVNEPQLDGGTFLDTVAVDDPTPPQPSRIVPIRHHTNQGVGAAIKTGYRRSLEDGFDVTVVVAGDGQTEPDIIERIVEPVATGRVDYAKGNRMLTREGMPMFRQVGNFVLALLTKIASGYWKVNDPQNGSTAISLEALEMIDIDALYDDYGFVNDLLVHLNVHGVRVADVPRRAVYKDERSHIDYKLFIPKLSYLLLRDFLWRLRVKYLQRDFHPLAFFYYLGATTAAIGGTGTVIGWWSTSTGATVSNGPVLFAIGVLMVLMAMVYDLKENEDLQEIGRLHDYEKTYPR